MKTSPEPKSAESDEDSKQDSKPIPFLASVSESELRNLLSSRGKSIDGGRDVLEDRVLSCHMQDEDLSAGSDHSNSDEGEGFDRERLDARGTSKKRSASESEMFHARDPLNTGQDRGARTKVCLSPHVAL